MTASVTLQGKEIVLTTSGRVTLNDDIVLSKDQAYDLLSQLERALLWLSEQPKPWKTVWTNRNKNKRLRRKETRKEAPLSHNEPDRFIAVG